MVLCAALDAKGKTPLSSLNNNDKIAIILGNEHRGIRPLVKQNCDLLTSIPMQTQVESLNVSNAAAIVFYELSKQTETI